MLSFIFLEVVLMVAALAMCDDFAYSIVTEKF
jgi:hypothetical protein